MDFFEKSLDALQSPVWKVFSFSSTENPRLAQHFCDEYEEELERAGFSNIHASSHIFSILPGIHYIYLYDCTRNLFVGGGRFHIHIPGYFLPIQKTITPYSKELNDYINHASTMGSIGELSGFWVNRTHIKSYINDLDLIQIITCLVLGRALKLKCQKIVCLSSRHLYKRALLTGFQTKKAFGVHGKIPYPADHYSYFMEWNLEEACLHVEQDILQLMYWARDNLRHCSVNDPILL